MELFQVIETLTDRDKWPWFYDPDRLNDLDALADEAFQRGTFDGYLACVLMTHQICDERLRVLIRHCRFVLHITLATSELSIHFGPKDDDSDLEKQMTEPLIGLLKASLEVDGKAEFIILCEEMTDIRNKLAHQLTRNFDLGGIRGTTEKYQKKFARAEELFAERDDIFRLLYKDHRKDDSWDLGLQDMLQNGLEPEAEQECHRIIAIRRTAGVSGQALEPSGHSVYDEILKRSCFP